MQPRPLRNAAATPFLWKLSILMMIVAVALRFSALGRIPGINADEAWYGVQTQALLAGDKVQYKTPTGLLPNPVHYLPLLALHLDGKPEFWKLRAPACLSGLLLLPLAYSLLRRTIGEYVAGSLLWLSSSLAILIAYSRFGWDASHTPLWSLLCLAFVLFRRPIAASVAFAVLLLIHPTNVFLAPILVCLAAGVEWSEKSPGDRRLSAESLARLGELATGLALIAACFWFVVPGQQGRSGHWLTRLASFDGWRSCLVLYGRFFSGATIHEYIAGPLSSRNVLWRDVLFWSVVGLVGLLGGFRAIRNRDFRCISLVVGLALAAVWSYLAAGTLGLVVGYERYSMFLAVPTLLAFSMLHANVFEKSARPALGHALLLALCFVMTGDYLYNTVQRIDRTGGESHRTFRTGKVEPKEAALAAVTAAAPPDRPIRLLAEDLWVYMPIRYLASRNRRVIVQSLETHESEAPMPGAAAFVVGFADGPFERSNAKLAPFAHIDDPLGRPILKIWKVSWVGVAPTAQ